MRITVIFTGGTIGSRTDGAWTSPDPAASYTLLRRFADEDVSFDTVTPYLALSETLSASKLNLLQDAVQAALDTAPDGIVVTHGTDTLPYTAAALSLAFADAAVPIVLVSAAQPLDHPLTNGFCNFEAALTCIRDGRLRGVLVSYRNDGDAAVTLHDARRLLQHAEGASDLFSRDGQTAAHVDTALHCHAPLPRYPAWGKVRYVPAPPLLTVDSRPEERYAYPLDGVKAILLKPYHSATLDTESDALRRLCEEAKRRRIPVFVCGVKAGPAYESCARFDEWGIRPAPCDTYVASFMTLWAAISRRLDVAALPTTTL